MLASSCKREMKIQRVLWGGGSSPLSTGSSRQAQARCFSHINRPLHTMTGIMLSEFYPNTRKQGRSPFKLLHLFCWLSKQINSGGTNSLISPVNLGFDLEQIATEMIFAGSNSLNSAS